MLDTLISLIAPHSCVSCGLTGSLLCASCRNDQIESQIDICIACGGFSGDGLCATCRSSWPVERALIFGERTDMLKTLIDEYKYGHKRAAYRELAGLVAYILPYQTNAVIVPVPTISSHIRQRGYDHMALLARAAARQNHLEYAYLLGRLTDSVQHGAAKQQRIAQAETAFLVRSALDPVKTYIILDDITTTGASLKAAAQVMCEAGARHVWVAALARQPLEQPLDYRSKNLYNHRSIVYRNTER